MRPRPLGVLFVHQLLLRTVPIPLVVRQPRVRADREFQMLPSSIARWKQPSKQKKRRSASRRRQLAPVFVRVSPIRVPISKFPQNSNNSDYRSTVTGCRWLLRPSHGPRAAHPRGCPAPLHILSRPARKLCHTALVPLQFLASRLLRLGLSLRLRRARPRPFLLCLIPEQGRLAAAAAGACEMKCRVVLGVHIRPDLSLPLSP
jgi:hypothetical protein